MIESKESKWLGKEVEYNKLMFEYMNDIRAVTRLGDNDAFIRIVNRMISSFPYVDDQFKKDFEELSDVLKKGRSSKDRYGRDNEEVIASAQAEFAEEMFKALMRLFKRVKLIPQPAEVSEL